MPPSPGVEHYKIAGWILPDEVAYEMKIKWRPETWSLMKTLPDKQVFHRSRDIAAAFSFLQVNEFAHQVNKTRQEKRYVDQLSGLLKPSQWEQLADVMFDETLKNMKFSMDKIQHYIAEHKNSSTGLGFKWQALEILDTTDWKLIFEAIKGWCEYAFSEEHRHMYYPESYRVGRRARSNALTPPLTNPQYVRASKNRDRRVMFRFRWSVISAFLSDKVAWYKNVFEEAIRLAGTSAEYHFPMLEGGKVYEVMAESLNEGYKHYAYDGGAWEQVCGAAMGPAYNVVMTQLEEFNSLPSGSIFTSMIGTLMNIISTKLTAGPNTRYILLGDDQNKLDKRDDQTKSWGSILEYQQADSEVMFVLGLAFLWDYFKPRLCGLKATIDNADHMMPMMVDRSSMTFEHQMEGKADERLTALWNGMYTGYIGDHTIYDRMVQRTAEQSRAGSETIVKLAEDEYATMSLDRATAWADT
jgi:hypothetical protein